MAANKEHPTWGGYRGPKPAGSGKQKGYVSPNKTPRGTILLNMNKMTCEKLRIMSLKLKVPMAQLVERWVLEKYSYMPEDE